LSLATTGRCWASVAAASYSYVSRVGPPCASWAAWNMTRVIQLQCRQCGVLVMRAIAKHSTHACRPRCVTWHNPAPGLIQEAGPISVYREGIINRCKHFRRVATVPTPRHTHAMKSCAPTCSSPPVAANRIVPWARPLPSNLSAVHSCAFRGYAVTRSGRRAMLRASARAACAAAVRDGATLDRPLRVAVVGGGPSGACAAETLAQNGIDTVLLERKMNNCKVRRSEACAAARRTRVRALPRPSALTAPARACSPAAAPSPCAWWTSSTYRWTSSTGRSPR